MYSIDITSAALSRIKQQYSICSFQHVRLGVRGGGCSGYMYVFEFENDNKRENDIIFFIDDIEFRIDKKSSLILKNTTLDFFEDGLNGRGFRFLNPNHKSSCGCGFSFDM